MRLPLLLRVVLPFILKPADIVYVRPHLQNPFTATPTLVLDEITRHYSLAKLMKLTTEEVLATLCRKYNQTEMPWFDLVDEVWV